MPELIDLKLPKKTEKELKAESTIGMPGERDKYPYGMELRFENEQFDKITALQGFKVGDEVLIMAKACVTACRESERQGGKKTRSCEMQIEKIAIEPAKKKKLENLTMKAYREEREKK
jgi:hypothetical protein